jgi:hypothetical protein
MSVIGMHANGAAHALLEALAALAVAVAVTTYLAYGYWCKTRDSDGDRIRDLDEVNVYQTNPYSRDTDGDVLGARYAHAHTLI